MRLINYFVTVIPFLLIIQSQAVAQDNLQVSVFPGYHVINSDNVSMSSDASKTSWVFGGSIATRLRIWNIPLEYSIGYSYGKSTVFERNFTLGFDPFYSVDLRYRTLPQELFRVYPISDKIELLAGINVTAQDRTLQYSNPDNEDDRLFSMGLGLSGKIHLVLDRSSSGNREVFLNLSARWTEFIYHDARNRNLDDYTLRHVTLSPQIGFSYSFH